MLQEETAMLQEETTAPAEDRRSDTAADGSCANPTELAAVGPTPENTVSPFRTTGRAFLVSYELRSFFAPFPTRSLDE